MSDRKLIRPLALAVGTALAGSVALNSAANADTGASPFSMTTLSAGYMAAAGEGNCGGDKGDKKAEGSCGGDKDAEGSCGGDKDAEGSCGGDKDAEGKCGEGKCGGSA